MRRVAVGLKSGSPGHMQVLRRFGQASWFNGAGKYTYCMYKKTSKLPSEFNLSSSRSTTFVMSAGKQRRQESYRSSRNGPHQLSIFVDECHPAVVPPLTCRP